MTDAAYRPRFPDWLLGVSLALASGAIAGFAPVTQDFGVERLSGVVTAIGIVGGIGILVCWIIGSMSSRRPLRGIPWIAAAVVLWVLQLVILHVAGWRLAVSTAGILAAAVIVVGWLQLHRYAAPAYGFLGILAAGAVVAALAPTYPILVATLVVVSLATMFGAALTQTLLARNYSAAR
jgi:hypothetical protein